MTKSTVFSAFLGAFFVVGLAVAPAHALATRTWVSGVGDDANPCSRTAPCKTFAGAISKTAAAGEINVLDPGGFGAVTITKSISIYNDGVGEAGVLVSGTNGIVISAATTDTVNLRGLIIDGLNQSSSQSGVSILQAARVVIMNCVIQEMGTGVSVATSANTNVKIQDTTFKENDAGIVVQPSGGIVSMSIDRSHLDSNTGGGVKVTGASGGSASVAINDSSVSLNSSNGVNSVGGTASTKVDLTRVVIADNGLAGVQSNGGTSTVTVGSSMLSNNGSAWSVVSGGVLQSYGNNQVTGPAGTGPSGSISAQ